MDQVRMVHPTLPGRHITVPTSSVPQHLRSGWQVATEHPAPTGGPSEQPPAPADTAEDGPAAIGLDAAPDPGPDTEE